MSSRDKCRHTALDPKCASCDKLKAKWEKKLASSGFEDIEQPDGNLKVWHGARFYALSDEIKINGPQKEEYYRLAGQFLWEYKFPDKKTRRIWELHCEGVGIVKIVEIVKKELGFTYRRKVHETLQKLSKEMLEKCRNPA